MPLFDYACKTCDHTFEALVFGEEKVECPKCAGEKLERLLSAPAKPLTSLNAVPGPCGQSSCACLAQAQGRTG